MATVSELPAGAVHKSETLVGVSICPRYISSGLDEANVEALVLKTTHRANKYVFMTLLLCPTASKEQLDPKARRPSRWFSKEVNALRVRFSTCREDALQSKFRTGER